MALFRVKICGITNVQDATMVGRAGADAVGLNFYTGSPRHVTPVKAREIAAALPSNVVKVGVFVNSPAGEVAGVFEQVGLDIVQLHGDEPPEILSLLARCPVVRAFRCRDSGFRPLIEYLDRCRHMECAPAAVLVDAYQPGSYGGTGAVTDWAAVSGLTKDLPDMPIVLAGGLQPENVAEAIRVARPSAVDVASGVESGPGRKDAERVSEFVRNALASFDLMDNRTAT
jgi:phosphoribosylanthranilate isomerase